MLARVTWQFIIMFEIILEWELSIRNSNSMFMQIHCFKKTFQSDVNYIWKNT